jgi:hypothetical protein
MSPSVLQVVLIHDVAVFLGLFGSVGVSPPF